MRVFCLASLLFPILLGRAYCQQFDDSSWMTTHWTADDTALRAERLRIVQLTGRLTELDKEAEAARKKCDSEKATAFDLFRWSCAVLVRSRGDFDYGSRLRMGTNAHAPMELFPKLSKPDSYEFTRVRLLLVANVDFPGRMMIPVAEALHARDPEDEPVALTLLYLYQPSAANRHPEDRTKGIALVRFIDTHFKPDVRTWARTGWFYYTAWMYTKSKADATEAIRRSGEARKLTKSEEQKRLIDREKQEMIKGTPGLKG